MSDFDPCTSCGHETPHKRLGPIKDNSGFKHNDACEECGCINDPRFEFPKGMTMSNPDQAEVAERLAQLAGNPNETKNLQGAGAADPLAKAASGASGQVGPARITLGNVREAFTYAPWDQAQVDAGKEVTEAMIAAAEVVLHVVPESPLRTRAINGLFDARMIANAAITHRGKF